MHEFSISQEIVKSVLNTALKNNGKKVLSIQLDVGELALLNTDQVTFWIRELFKGSVAEGARVKFKELKARIWCGECQYRGRLGSKPRDASQHLIQHSCPKCGSLQIMIEKGRECILRRIQMVR